jgi:predicted ATPase with chaperone activity
MRALTIASTAMGQQCRAPMTVRRLTTILPRMRLAEAIATTRIHRVAGLTGDLTVLVTTRPFRATHPPLSRVDLEA